MKEKWYYNKSWDEEIEKHFFTKLSRVRHRGSQAQYLNIQAGGLIYTKDPELLKVAERLLNKQLQEYQDSLFAPDAYLSLGKIYEFRRKYDEAFAYYKMAIDFEGEHPNLITNSFMDFAELAVKTNRTVLFEYVENLFAEERYISAVAFPLTKYLKYSILSIINTHKGDAENAKYYFDLANKSAALRHSGFRNHKSLGLVDQRDEELDKLVGLGINDDGTPTLRLRMRSLLRSIRKYILWGRYSISRI